jgi:hypothetical protein
LGSGFGEVGTSEKRCEYFIEDLGTKERMGDYRVCGKALVQIPVGPGQACSSSYNLASMSSGKCLVYTRAFDRAGNDSGWKSTLFNIDLMPPSVGPIAFSSDKLDPFQEYLFETQVSDNNHVSGCSFYVDGDSLDLKTSVIPTPCEHDGICLVAASYSFADTGVRHILFGCKDAAGNVGYGKDVPVTVFVNSRPQITSCRVTPAEGDVSTIFHFSLEAQDPDGDALSPRWDFGDGMVSEEMFPLHTYNRPGTYTPAVVIKDSQVETTSCATSWVVIKE